MQSREEEDERLLQAELASALIARGFRRLVLTADERWAKTRASSVRDFIGSAASKLGMPTWAALVILFTALNAIGVDEWWWYAAATPVTLLVLAFLVSPPELRRLVEHPRPAGLSERLRVPSAPVAPAVAAVGGGLVTVAWGIFGFEITVAGPSTVAVTHGAPAAVVLVLLTGAAAIQLAVKLVRRLGFRHVGANITMLAPIALVVLFVQLFSAEVWSVADAMTVPRGLGLAAITVVPLFVVLVIKLGRSVTNAFDLTRQRLTTAPGDDLPDSAERLVQDLERAGVSGDAARSRIQEALAAPRLIPRARAISDALTGSFGRPLFLGLMPIVFGTWMLMSGYIYLLAAVTIDPRNVETWLDPPGDASFDVPSSDLGVSFPGGPYIVLALMLAVVATAVFMASALTDPEYRKVLADSALHGRVEDCLVHAAPYVDVTTRNADPERPQPLGGPADSVVGDTRYAWHDANVDGTTLANALWYRWTAPGAAWVTFVVSSAWPDDRFDPKLLVKPSDSWRERHGTPNFGHIAPERVSVDVEAGTELDICVGSALRGRSSRGVFTLTWAPSPPNATFAAARGIFGRAGSVTGDTTYACRETAEPAHASLVGGRSVWFAWTAPASEWTTFETEGSGFDTLLAVYTGSSLDELQPVDANDDVPGARWSRVHFFATAGTRYVIAVDGYDDAAGPFRLRWRPAPPPPNSEPSSAQELQGVEGSVSADTTFAHVRTSATDAEPADAALWFRWTAPESEWMLWEAQSASFAPWVAVATALDGEDLALVENRAGDGSPPGTVHFAAVAGTTYHIAVAAAFGHGGPVALSWRKAPVPANDAFGDAQTLVGADGEVSGFNTYATAEDGEPPHAAHGGRSVWFRWTAPSNGLAIFTTKGTRFDTLLAAYSGSELAALRSLDANDDAFGARRASRVAFTARAGETYRIAVDGFAGASGSFRLRWRMRRGLGALLVSTGRRLERLLD